MANTTAAGPADHASVPSALSVLVGNSNTGPTPQITFPGSAGAKVGHVLNIAQAKLTFVAGEDEAATSINDPVWRDINLILALQVDHRRYYPVNQIQAAPNWHGIHRLNIGRVHPLTRRAYIKEGIVLEGQADDIGHRILRLLGEFRLVTRLHRARSE